MLSARSEVRSQKVGVGFSTLFGLRTSHFALRTYYLHLAHVSARPPSILTVAPVIQVARSDARK